MKRIIGLASLVLVMASCSNSGESTADRVKDSLDSIERLKVESVNEAAEAAIDTIQQRNESLKEKVDSVVDNRQ